MSLYECVLRAYHFYGGQADNELISDYVADRRPESKERLHERLIPNVVQALQRQGFIRNIVRGQRYVIGVWQLTQAGQQAAHSLVNPS